MQRLTRTEKPITPELLYQLAEAATGLTGWRHFELDNGVASCYVSHGRREYILTVQSKRLYTEWIKLSYKGESITTLHDNVACSNKALELGLLEITDK